MLIESDTRKASYQLLMALLRTRHALRPVVCIWTPAGSHSYWSWLLMTFHQNTLHKEVSGGCCMGRNSKLLSAVKDIFNCGMREEHPVANTLYLLFLTEPDLALSTLLMH
jgi:hypothetical protein